jgi:hypothetical protein
VELLNAYPHKGDRDVQTEVTPLICPLAKCSGVQLKESETP